MKANRFLLCGFCVAWLTASATAATNLVLIGNYFFNPTNLVIAVGDTVLWSNTVASSTVHDSTSTNAAMPWASGDLTSTRRTFALTFTNAGRFPYICARHVLALINPHPEQTGTVTVVAANLPPTVGLIQPPDLARFRAPATLLVEASASDPDGAITNVEFFLDGALLGSDSVAPYRMILSNLAAANYILTARALDNAGAATTSAPVRISVLTNALLSLAQRLPAGRFRFSVSGVASQLYTLEFSSNALHWVAVLTNPAPSDFFSVTDATATNVLQRFYRMRQDL